MSLQKLKRTLHREFTRNPAKSCTLLALLPVAGYFIGPLVWKQFPGAKASGVAQATQIQVTDAGSAALATTTVPQAAVRWQEIAQWIEKDARMKPATFASVRDPFSPVTKTSEPDDEEKKRSDRPTPVVATLRPEDCGLELTATIVGTAKRLATISGRLYAENARIYFGDTPRAPDASSPVEDPFVLKSVAKNYVVLERHGKSFQLPLVRGIPK